jgi:hypothetical protein
MSWSTVAIGLVFCVALAQDTGQAPQADRTFIPSTGQTYYLDLDTVEGAFSEWRHDDLVGLCALQASVRVPRVRTHLKYKPTFSIWLQAGVIPDKTKRIGLQITSKISKPPLDIRVIQLDSHEMISEQNSNTRLGLDAAIPVEMVWLPDHSVIVKIGQNEIHRFKIPWQVERISITASTGEMKIDPLILGCFGSAPHQ